MLVQENVEKLRAVGAERSTPEIERPELEEKPAERQEISVRNEKPKTKNRVGSMFDLLTFSDV